MTHAPHRASPRNDWDISTIKAIHISYTLKSKKNKEHWRAKIIVINLKKNLQTSQMRLRKTTHV